MIYRGDCIPKDINAATWVLKEKNKVKFCDVCGIGMRVQLEYTPVGCVPGDILDRLPRSACAISNTTVLREVFERNIQNFDKMFAKRAFVHWYLGEGMEEAEFGEAKENVANLVQDYEEIEAYYPDEDEEGGATQFN